MRFRTQRMYSDILLFFSAYYIVGTYSISEAVFDSNESLNHLLFESKSESSHCVCFVYCSVVLVSFLEHECPSVKVILGHAVTDVQILASGTEETERRMKSLFLPDTTQVLSKEELKSRRENLRLWLEKNRVPVTEDGDVLRVASVLTISAPYGTGDCSCANEIILARVQSLVESIPGTEHTSLS